MKVQFAVQKHENVVPGAMCSAKAGPFLAEDEDIVGRLTQKKSNRGPFIIEILWTVKSTLCCNVEMLEDRDDCLMLLDNRRLCDGKFEEKVVNCFDFVIR